MASRRLRPVPPHLRIVSTGDPPGEFVARRTKWLRLRLGHKDRERLELISASYGVSLSAAARMVIRAACVRLGIETGDLQELLANK